MKEIGKVVEVNKNLATVRLSRKASCENCNQCGLKKRDTHIDIVVENLLNVSVGDDVTIEMSNANVVKSALIIYVIPLVLSLIGLLIGELFKMEEIFQIVLIFGGLLIGGFAVFLIDKKLKKQKFLPNMVEIVKDSSNN